MTKFLTVAQVIALHDSEKLCALLDLGKLESAVGQPSATWGGEYLYPTLIQQAAALLFCVCNAHAFEDANKRAAWLSCVTFLDLNGVDFLDIPQIDVEDLMVAVADSGLSIADIAIWLTERI
jgi:death on curing protein